MKYKHAILFAVLFGIVMACLWSVVFSNISGHAGIGIGLCFGAAFACCGFLFGYAIDRKDRDKEQDPGDREKQEDEK